MFPLFFVSFICLFLLWSKLSINYCLGKTTWAVRYLPHKPNQTNQTNKLCSMKISHAAMIEFSWCWPAEEGDPLCWPGSVFKSQLSPPCSNQTLQLSEKVGGVSRLLKTDPGRQRGSPSSAGQHQLICIMAVWDNLMYHSLFVLVPQQKILCVRQAPVCSSRLPQAIIDCSLIP